MPFSELGRVSQKLLHPMTTLLRERKNGAMPFSELGRVFQKLLHPMITHLREQAKWCYAFFGAR